MKIFACFYRQPVIQFIIIIVINLVLTQINSNKMSKRIILHDSASTIAVLVTVVPQY